MESVTIRSLQHYLYCPHRWGLIEIDCAWAENIYVVKSNVDHERVHSGEQYSLRGKKVYTDVNVWSDALGLSGKIDCLEENGKNLALIEYKPTMPKDSVCSYADSMQIFAQKICIEENLGVLCDTFVFYRDTRKRIRLDFTDSYIDFWAALNMILSEMRKYMDTGLIPSIRIGQKCNGCSMKDLCMPGVFKHKKQNTVRCLLDLDGEI